MTELQVGQVLALKIRYNNDGLIANSKHPYLVVDVNAELGFVEIAQIDSLAGKEYKAARRSNKIVYADEPNETVIDRDSYVQLDNTFRVELFDGLANYRRQTDRLSEKKLADVIGAYRLYHRLYTIDENKIVYMDRAEIVTMNPVYR